MSLFGKSTRRLVFGATLGASAVWLAPHLGPIVIAVVRPVIKGVVVETAIAVERFTVRMSELGESVQDFLAEVRLELERRHAAEAASRDRTPESGVQASAGAA